jgi:hypothetical protein
LEDRLYLEDHPYRVGHRLLESHRGHQGHLDRDLEDPLYLESHQGHLDRDLEDHLYLENRRHLCRVGHLGHRDHLDRDLEDRLYLEDRRRRGHSGHLNHLVRLYLGLLEARLC